MSKLHHDMVKKYGTYNLGFKPVELTKTHYIFNLIANDNIQIVGTAIPIGTYDPKKNVLIWSNISNTLDKNIVKEVIEIRKKLVESDFIIASKDFSIISTRDVYDILEKISLEIKKDIIIDKTHLSMHIFLVQKIIVNYQI